jgi:uncharacterized cupredoxin-like copper-binding protein
MEKSNFFIILLVVSNLSLLLACSRQTEPNTIEIRAGEFSFQPGTIQLKAGRQVRIELINEGNIEHEFMVGREVKLEENENGTHEGMPEAVEVGHEHRDGSHGAHARMSRRFEKDFFQGIVVNHTEKEADFIRVPGHGTMVILKPNGKATITFKLPTDRKGQWEMACFVGGHYEADMKGLIIIN